MPKGDKEIVLEKEDLIELIELYQDARDTPVLFYGASDTATDAWNSVQRKMDELGKKYGFDPKVSSIDPKTGIVMKRGE